MKKSEDYKRKDADAFVPLQHSISRNHAIEFISSVYPLLGRGYKITKILEKVNETLMPGLSRERLNNILSKPEQYLPANDRSDVYSPIIVEAIENVMLEFIDSQKAKSDKLIDLSNQCLAKSDNCLTSIESIQAAKNKFQKTMQQSI